MFTGGVITHKTWFLAQVIDVEDDRDVSGGGMKSENDMISYTTKAFYP
jgi:hypothetical protein